MTLKKIYSFTNKRQIWRLLLTKTNNFIIEERDAKSAEAFFNCLNVETGRIIFENLQFDEKSFIGIETAVNDFIVFHFYEKPDMPTHKGFFVYDVLNKKILWQNPSLSYLFIYDNKLFAYSNTFEGREFYSMNLPDGSEFTKLPTEYSEINSLLQKANSEENFEDYYFPKIIQKNGTDPEISNLIGKIKSDSIIKGPVEYIKYGGLLLYNYHKLNNFNSLTNCFEALEIEKEKIIFKQVLNKSTNNFAPDSFFVNRDKLFLLREKTAVDVYRIVIN